MQNLKIKNDVYVIPNLFRDPLGILRRDFRLRMTLRCQFYIVIFHFDLCILHFPGLIGLVLPSEEQNYT